MPLKKKSLVLTSRGCLMGLCVVSSSPTNCCFDIVWGIFKSLRLKSVSSSCPSTLHAPLVVPPSRCKSTTKRFLPAVCCTDLKLGRVRTKCLRLSLLQELPVLLNVLRNMCDQPAGCGLAVHVEGISKGMLFWSLVNGPLKCQQITLSTYLL